LWWIIAVAQDITAGFSGYDTVSFSASGLSHTWRFGTDGILTLPNDMTIDSYGTSGANATVTIGGDNTEIRIDNDGAPPGLYITTDKTGESYQWLFGSDGDLHIPPGKTIRNAMTGDDLLAGGGGSTVSNVWVQTFESANPLLDIPVIALSVEYDSVGNVIALFYHSVDGGGSYYSVGKYTASGTRIWTTRFDTDYETDGWGLAVDTTSGFIYVAGKTNANGGQQNATLTKIASGGGSVEWSNTYAFGIDINSNSQVVDVASDGNPVMVGYVSNGTDDYVATTKVDAEDGSIIWSKKLDGQADEQAYGMAVGPNNEVVAVGYMSQLGLGSTNAVATVVTVPSSNPNWTTQYGGGDGINENYQGIIFDIIVTNGVPAITIKTDPVGNRTIGDTIMTLPGDSFGGVNGVDDMVVNVASVSSTAGSEDNHMLVVKYNSAGAMQWQKAILFDAGFDSTGADADIDSEGNVYVCGQYEVSDPTVPGICMNLVKFNSAGVKQWSRRVEGDCGSIATSIVVGADDKLYLSGSLFSSTVPNPGPSDPVDLSCVVAKYNLDGTVAWQRLLDNTESSSVSGSDFISSQGGGSNLAVKQNYVALAGGFGTDPVDFRALIAQLPAAGDPFAVGVWDFKASSLTGILNTGASDITVVNADKTNTDNTSNITVATVTPAVDSSDFLIGTLYSSGIGTDNQLVNGAQTLVLNANGSVTFPDGSIQLTAYQNTSGVFLLHESADPEDVTTPTKVTIDGMPYGGGNVVTDSAFGPGSSRVTLYADSMFAMVAVNADINTVYYNGESGSDGDGTKAVSSGVSNYRGYYSYHNIITGDDPAIQQIVISKSATMSGSNRSIDTNNDDFTVTGLAGSDVVIVLNLYWNLEEGPDEPASTTTAIEEFIDRVMFDNTTPRTDISAIRTAFYANSSAIRSAIENDEVDYLYDGFTFYESFPTVTPTGGSGTGAVLEIQVGNGLYYSEDVLVPGTGYTVGNTLTVPGDLLGGATPTNDVTITVDSINGTGGITNFSVAGASVYTLWPLSYINDGDNDQYDVGNFIGTDRTRVTAIVTLAYIGGGEGVSGNEIFPTLTVLSTDKALTNNGVGQWVWFENDNSGAFINWTLSISAGNDDRLVNGTQEFTLNANGSVTLPQGGTITEGYVTSNPTIQLTPATPSVASQKLVIKGGGSYSNTENGIYLSTNNITWAVSTTVVFYVYDPTRANETLYWWIVPEGAGISTTMSGTVALDGIGDGNFTFTLDSDAYEFRVRVSPEDNNYDPNNTGVESVLINGDEPTFEGEHHLHLTTGNLTETSIFLGTDDHNVRTTVDGKIQITTPDTVNNVWEFGTDGTTSFPNNAITTSNTPLTIQTKLPATYGPFNTAYFESGNGSVNGVHPGTYAGYFSITTVNVNNDGTYSVSGYPASIQNGTNPTYTISGVDLGGTSPANDCLLTVTTVDDIITTVAVSGTPLLPKWTFGEDGTTTFPTLTVPISDNATPSGTGQTIKFGDSSQQAIIFGPEALSPGSPSAQRVIIQGAPGYTGTAGEGGDVYVWAGPGGSTDGNGGDIKVRAGQGDGTGGGGYLNFQAGDSGTGNGGWINIESGQSNTYGNGGDITVQAHDGGEIFLRTHNSITTQTWTLGADGTTTLPGAVVKSTVAKTGIAYNTGTATALEDSTYIGSIVDGSYGPFTRGLVTFTVVVTSGVAAYTVTATTGNTAVGAVIGTLDTGDLGGTSGSTANISVADVVQSSTVIDLTKTVNKLTDGFYTLADGVEGQIMYLVKQTGTVFDTVTVIVANARVNGVLNTSVEHYPFTYNESSIDIDTLIFTDGAWQAVGGEWD
jgi:hypothetical protein